VNAVDGGKRSMNVKECEITGREGREEEEEKEGKKNK
jgi:hypothetical protein